MNLETTPGISAIPERGGASLETLRMSAQDWIDDRAYFIKRAREERDKAAECEDNAAALAHLRLADEYARRAEDLTAKRPISSSPRDARIQ